MACLRPAQRRRPALGATVQRALSSSARRPPRHRLRGRGGGDGARRRALAVLAPATPNGRDLAAALVGSLHVPAFGPVRAARLADGILETEQATLQGSVITTSRPADGAPTPSVVLVLANTFTPAEVAGGAAEVTQAPAAEESAFAKATVAESHPAEAKVVNLEEATVLVAGGRGVGGEGGFARCASWTRRSARGGTSRAAADAGWILTSYRSGRPARSSIRRLHGAGISGAHRVGIGIQTPRMLSPFNAIDAR